MGASARLSAAVFWLCCWSGEAAWADAPPDCARSEPERGTVVEVVDGETLRLAEGNTLRLVGSKSPRPPAGIAEEDWPPAQDARIALERLTKGKAVSLRYGGRKTDRHGFLMAQVFVVDAEGSQVWVQGALVEQGLGRVYSLPDNAACTRELLVREAGARAAGLGVWAWGAYAVRAASAVDRLGRLRGTYQLVEGEVRKVAQVQEWIFLNFDADWRQDFTVAIEKKRAKSFAEAGLDLEDLAGKRIRVRGWLEWRHGPSMSATHPEQIEILSETGIAGKAAGARTSLAPFDYRAKEEEGGEDPALGTVSR